MKTFTRITESTMLGPIATQKFGAKSINTLNKKIINYINNEYAKYGHKYQGPNKDIVIDGHKINTEYIDKMVNGYNIFKSVIAKNHITDEDEFYHYMDNHLADIYSPNGAYFRNTTLPILIANTENGKRGERNSLEHFRKKLSEKGIDVTMETPTTEEDISGIDGKFQWNGKTVTIQVKPYSSYQINNGVMKVYSQGSLSLNTDYLILYKDNDFIIVKGKVVTIDGNYFIFDKSNAK